MKTTFAGRSRHAAHVIRVPLRAIRHVDAHRVALRDEALVQVAAHAVEHLELEAIGRDLVLVAAKAMALSISRSSCVAIAG